METRFIDRSFLGHAESWRLTCLSLWVHLITLWLMLTEEIIELIGPSKEKKRTVSMEF